MLSEAFEFPKAGDDWLPTILIGGVLSILSALVLPAFVLQGYLVRALRDGAAGERAAPSFTQWGELLVDGLKLFVVNIVYSIVVVIPMFIGLSVVGGLGVVAGESNAGALFTGLVGLVILLLFVVLGLLLAYVVPAAMANFAIEGRIGAAFAFGTIREGAFTSEYATAWVLSIVVSIVGGIVGGALSLILVGIFVLFYVQVMTYFLWGRGFAAGLDARSSPSI